MSLQPAGRGLHTEPRNKRFPVCCPKTPAGTVRQGESSPRLVGRAMSVLLNDFSSTLRGRWPCTAGEAAGPHRHPTRRFDLLGRTV